MRRCEHANSTYSAHMILQQIYNLFLIGNKSVQNNCFVSYNPVFANFNTFTTA